MDSLARNGLERVNANYWFKATEKRLAAAEETLTELDQHIPASTGFLRQVAAPLPAEEKVKVFKAGLECVAGSVFPIPALAVAVVQACPQTREAVLSLHPDPLAARLKDEQKAVEVLARLPGPPLERAHACGKGSLEGLSPKARLDCDREIARGTGSPLLDRVSALQTIGPKALERGLARAGSSELEIGAAMVGAQPDVALVELARPQLPSAWTALVGSLDPACANVEERTRLGAGALELAVDHPQSDPAALARQLGEVSEALATSLLKHLPFSPTVQSWHEQAALLKLTPGQVLEGSLQLLANDPISLADLVEQTLRQSEDPSQADALLGAARQKASRPDQQAWLAGLQASRGGLAALRASQGAVPTNFEELVTALGPVLEESEEPLPMLAAALPHFSALVSDPVETRKLKLLEFACTGEQYEPPTIWNGISAALEEPGADLIRFSSSLVEPMRFWMDGDRVGAEALRQLESQAARDKDEPLEKAAHFLGELQEGLEEERERHGVITQGLAWLTENAPSPTRWGELARALRQDTQFQRTDLVIGKLAAHSLAAESDPGLSQQGRFLEAVAGMRSENLNERMEAVFEGLDRVAPGRSLAYLAAGVASHFGESHLDRQKVAFQAFDLMSQCGDDRQKAMARLLRGLASQDRDLAANLLESFDDEELEPDPAWLGATAVRAVANGEGCDRALLLDGLDDLAAAWGDRKLIPPAVARARQTGDLEELADKLEQFQGDGYWLVSAAQGQENSTQVAERSDHVIIGGVTVRKNQED